MDKLQLIIDEISTALSQLDEENLSFHNLVILENIREMLVHQDAVKLIGKKNKDEIIPPVPGRKKMECVHTVAIIDDDQDTQNLLKYYFEKNGLAVTSYHSALNALEKINDEHFDLLLVDLMMPEMTGFEFIQKIKKKINLDVTRIIIGSAKNNHLDRVNALNMGAVDFINKPYDLSELFLLVKRNIEKDVA